MTTATIDRPAKRSRKAAGTLAAGQAQRIVAAEAMRLSAVQLGFAWQCAKDECSAGGNDRAEYAGHMKGHGFKPPRPVKRIKLRTGAPAASLPKLEVPPFKWLRWTQEHVTPGTCECGHTTGAHHARHGTASDGEPTTMGACESCPCRVEFWSLPAGTTQSAERRGQFWSAGPHPHSIWVLPFDAAPWEDGNAAPVLVYPGKPGRAFTDAYSARYDRR